MIAALFQEEPVFVDFSNGVQQSPILKDTSARSTEKGTDAAPTTSTAQSRWTMVVTFDKYGKKIYTGSNRGYISIIDTETRTVSLPVSQQLERLWKIHVVTQELTSRLLHLRFLDVV